MVAPVNFCDTDLLKEYSPEFALRSHLSCTQRPPIPVNAPESAAPRSPISIYRYVYVELHALPVRFAKLLGFNKAGYVPAVLQDCVLHGLTASYL